MKNLYIKTLMMVGKIIFRGKWGGHKTMIAGVIEIILGLWIVIEGTLFPTLCEYIPFFCNISEAGFYGSIIIGIGFLKQILRTITDKPIPTLSK